jgi:hypothetical protein
MYIELPDEDDMVVLKITFIDDHESIKEAEKMLPCTVQNAAQIDRVKAVFKRHGWEGDGELGIFWLPPFLFNHEKNDAMTYGTGVWHVKQHNNGISFLGFSRDGLEYVRSAASLVNQNESAF